MSFLEVIKSSKAYFMKCVIFLDNRHKQKYIAYHRTNKSVLMAVILLKKLQKDQEILDFINNLKIIKKTFKKRGVVQECQKYINKLIKNQIIIFIIFMNTQKPKPFKQVYPLQKRIKMFEDGKAKNPNSVVVVVQKDPKCKILPELKHSRFSIADNQKIMQVCNAIRQRILAIDKKFQNQPFFLFTKNNLPNKQKSIKQIYATQKDPEDGLLYFQYSNVDPF